MSGNRAKSMRRAARRCVQESLTSTCETFFNSMCRLPFKRRFVLSWKILAGGTLKGRSAS